MCRGGGSRRTMPSPGREAGRFVLSMLQYGCVVQVFHDYVAELKLVCGGAGRRERGDVVMAASPTKPGHTVCKRCVALRRACWRAADRPLAQRAGPCRRADSGARRGQLWHAADAGGAGAALPRVAAGCVWPSHLCKAAAAPPHLLTPRAGDNVRNSIDSRCAFFEALEVVVCLCAHSALLAGRTAP